MQIREQTFSRRRTYPKEDKRDSASTISAMGDVTFSRPLHVTRRKSTSAAKSKIAFNSGRDRMNQPNLSCTEFLMGDRTAAKMFHDFLYTQNPEPSSRPNSRIRTLTGFAGTTQPVATSQFRPGRRRGRNSGSLVSQLLTSPVNSPRLETNSVIGNNDESLSPGDIPNDVTVLDPRKPSFACYWDTQLVVNPEPVEINQQVYPPQIPPFTSSHSRWFEYGKRDSVSASEFSSSIRRTSHGISSRKVSNEDSGIALEKSPKHDEVEKVDEQQKINRNFTESLC